ncbi:hypothetical protein N7490_011648 [Penicillium lividum]|nr:hypothetical protein N7490_011648 [Penicillium lividum]
MTSSYATPSDLGSNALAEPEGMLELPCLPQYEASLCLVRVQSTKKRGCKFHSYPQLLSEWGPVVPRWLNIQASYRPQ